MLANHISSCSLHHFATTSCPSLQHKWDHVGSVDKYLDCQSTHGRNLKPSGWWLYHIPTNASVCVHVGTCGLLHKHAYFGNHCQKHVIAAPASGDVRCRLGRICMLLSRFRLMDEWCTAHMVRCSWCGGVVWFFHSAIWPSSPLVFKVKADLTALSAKDQRLCRVEERACLALWLNALYSEYSPRSRVFTCVFQKSIFFLDIDDLAVKIDMFTNETLLQLYSVKMFQSCQDLN